MKQHKSGGPPKLSSPFINHNLLSHVPEMNFLHHITISLPVCKQKLPGGSSLFLYITALSQLKPSPPLGLGRDPASRLRIGIRNIRSGFEAAEKNRYFSLALRPLWRFSSFLETEFSSLFSSWISFKHPCFFESASSMRIFFNECP